MSLAHIATLYAPYIVSGFIKKECNNHSFVGFTLPTLREESSQTNVILKYKLLALILSAVCSIIQQS